MSAPACTCNRQAEDAHDERCAYVKWLRSPAYEDDVLIPEFLRRAKKPADGGVFD